MVQDRRSNHSLDELSQKITRNSRDLHDHLYDVQKTLKQSLEDQVDKMEGLKLQIQNEREFLNSKLSAFESAEKMTEFIRKSIKEAEDRLEEKIAKDIRVVSRDVEKIWRENLVLPGFIGKGTKCKYPNLKMYINAQTERTTQFEEQFKILATTFSEKNNSLRHKIVKVNEELLERIQKERDQQAKYTGKVSNDLDEKFEKVGELKGEVMAELKIMQDSLSSFKPHEAMAAIEQKLGVIQKLGEDLKADAMERAAKIEEEFEEKMKSFQSSIERVLKDKNEEMEYQLADVERRNQIFTNLQLKRRDTVWRGQQRAAALVSQ